MKLNKNDLMRLARSNKNKRKKIISYENKKTEPFEFQSPVGYLAPNQIVQSLSKMQVLKYLNCIFCCSF